MEDKNYQELKEEIKNINEKNKILEEKLEKILFILNNEVVSNTKKMSNHIDFIENIYSHVKFPLAYVCNKINYLSNIDHNYISKKLLKKEII